MGPGLRVSDAWDVLFMPVTLPETCPGTATPQGRKLRNEDQPRARGRPGRWSRTPAGQPRSRLPAQRLPPRPSAAPPPSTDLRDPQHPLPRCEPPSPAPLMRPLPGGGQGAGAAAATSVTGSAWRGLHPGPPHDPAPLAAQMRHLIRSPDPGHRNSQRSATKPLQTPCPRPGVHTFPLGPRIRNNREPPLLHTRGHRKTPESPGPGGRRADLQPPQMAPPDPALPAGSPGPPTLPL
ncbi:uncharacterized protein LOC132216287 [Myotis daubentonii]|uniref:uncharacterized protein LOC132216287 n=1 Tax=Myotis daubentonii TaxID=98922 RepID=UPI002873E9DE|nr:uncharacterized protein LOC132216287 [Myotis daubentonii]